MYYTVREIPRRFRTLKAIVSYMNSLSCSEMSHFDGMFVSKWNKNGRIGVVRELVYDPEAHFMYLLKH